MSILARFAIENSRFLILCIVAVIFAGISIYFSQPRQEDPEITIRSAKVTAKFPGMSPERIEQLIIQPIEEELKTMPEVKEIKSVATTGSAVITPQLYDRYFDLEPIWSDLRNKMEDLKSQLPEGTQGPFVNDDFGKTAVITLALSGDNFDMREMRWMARHLRDQITAVPLVASVDLYGIQDERIWLEFDPVLLSQFGLTPASVFQTINQQNIVLPGGSVNANSMSVVVEPSGAFKSVEEIRSVTITTPNGGLVYLRDLMNIRRGYIDPPNKPVLYNGKQAVIFGISMVSGSNIADLGKNLTEKIAELQGQLPLGLSLERVTWQPDLVEKNVNDATMNLGQTMAIVLAVVMFFLGLRMGLIVGIMVPLAIMLSLIGMSIWGIELHRVSIAAIIVALGLLIDNGIVVVEDIATRMAKGLERVEASIEAVKALAVPLLTSSLTTILAFMPLMLAENASGEYLRSLSLVIMLTLLSSWLLAVTVMPAMCVWFLKKPTRTSDQQDTGVVMEVYKGILSLLLRIRLPFIAAMVAMLILAINLMGFVKQRHMAPSDRNQFTVYINLPAGSNTKETQKVVQRLASYLSDQKRNPEITSNVLYIASGGPRFFLALSPPDPQINLSFGIVTTKQPNDIFPVMKRVKKFIAESLPEANGRVEELFLGPAPLGTVELRAQGPDIKTLMKLSNQLQNVMYAITGVDGIRSDWENPVLKAKVIIDQERARRVGVTSKDIADALSAQIDGSKVTDYREGDKVIPVMLRAGEIDRNDLDRLRTLEVFSQTSTSGIPLLQVADFQGVVEPSKIVRYDQQRAVTIAGKHQFLSAKDLYAKLQPEIAKIQLPPGYKIVPQGELKVSKEANSALFKYAPHCLFGIVILLVLQFNSFRRLLIVGLTIPLIIVGTALGLLTFNAWFDFVAMLGIFSLAGIIINNGIVMIDRVDQEREAGRNVDEAVINAALARARPIIMTTLTTIMGLIPLALFGGQFWYGMAIVIMGGLAIGTVLTLGVVPVLYSLLFNFWKNA